MAEQPDFWMGMADGYPTDWAGPKRRCYVVDRTLLATGRPAWRVSVQPALPRPSSDGTVSELIVAERYAGEFLDGADADGVTVNVASATNADAAERDRFEDGDLDLHYVAEAGRRPELLPAE